MQARPEGIPREIVQELVAMSDIVIALDALSGPAQHRVLSWVISVYKDMI